MGTESLGVNGSEVDLATVSLSDGLDSRAELITLLLGLGEDISERDASGHVVGIGLRANLANKGGGSLLGELLDRLSVELAIVDNLALVEALVEDNGRGLNTLSLSKGGLAASAEREVVTQLLGGLGKGLVGDLVGSVQVRDNDDLVGLLELFQGILGESGNSREGLLDHVRRDASSLALALVRGNVVKAAEDLEGGVALNTVLLAEVLLLCAVDLHQLDVLLLEGGGGLLVLGGEGLAVATPGGEDCSDR